jgi:hypothetical protein
MTTKQGAHTNSEGWSSKYFQKQSFNKVLVYAMGKHSLDDLLDVLRTDCHSSLIPRLLLSTRRSMRLSSFYRDFLPFIETFVLISRLSTTLHIEFELPPILNMDLPNPDYSGDPKIDDEAPVPYKTLTDPTTGYSTLIYSNPCTCDECRRQFRNLKDQEDKEEFVYGTSLSPVKAQEDAQARVRKINEALAYLREKLASHGNTVVNKW